MKKLAGIILVVMMASVAVTGCYTKTCCNKTPVYKGEG